MTDDDFKPMHADQAKGLDQINQIIGAAEREIAGIDPQLRAEVVAERAGQIRERAIQSLSVVRTQMLDRAGAAERAQRDYEPAALRRSARFHADDHADATMRLATFATLERTPLADLVVHMEDAVIRGNLALAEAARLEFARRPVVPTETSAEFSRTLGRLHHPFESVRTRLQEVRGTVSMADVRLAEFLRGKSNPAGRISAAREMGAR